LNSLLRKKIMLPALATAARVALPMAKDVAKDLGPEVCKSFAQSAGQELASTALSAMSGGGPSSEPVSYAFDTENGPATY
jgi:hypothetical protein